MECIHVRHVLDVASLVKGVERDPTSSVSFCGFELDADLNAARNIAHIGKSEMGRLRASKPNTTSNESMSIRGHKDDELSCKSESELVAADSASEKDSDNWPLLENDRAYRSTTSFFIECGWTGTRLGRI
jgi:hypothetical protein